MFSTAVVAGALLAADNDHWNGPGGWWPIFPIFWLLFFLTVAFLLSRRFRHCRPGSRSGIARLSERFAAGEIDEDEYRERLAVLKEERS